MTREDAVALLKGGADGVREWNRRRLFGQQVLDLEGVSLSGCSLRYVDLRRADLAYADLSGCDLGHARLHRSTLRSADLSGAEAGYADFRDADLSWAILAHTNLRNANLRSTSLTGASLAGAILGYTTVAADLSQTADLTEIVHTGPSEVSVRTLLSLPDQGAVGFLRGVGLADEEVRHFLEHSGRHTGYLSAFISYAHEDREFASKLHDELQRRGVRCWLDAQDGQIGQRIHEAISRAIGSHDRVLLCCSRASLSSWWVDQEIGHAMAKERAASSDESGSVVLVPLNLDDYLLSMDWTSGWATEVRGRIAADFRDWADVPGRFESEVERLLDSLRVT